MAGVEHVQETGRSGPAPGSGHYRVIVVEDNRADALLVQHAFEMHRINAEITILPDGEGMIAALDRIEAGAIPPPDLILLDLNLPRRDGFEVLTDLRQRSSWCKDLPVVIVTSSDAARDRETTSNLGINAYFRKPSDYDQFMQLGELVRRILEPAAAG
jgi:chemotaxis family two-component system response regulator Rcp1